jgi:ligand-binding SRPBCC domain-containing protein
MRGHQDTRPVVHVLERHQLLPRPRDAVFAFFADAFNLEAITPPWLGFRVVTTGPIEMARGTPIEYRLRLHGLRVDWLTRIEIWEPGRRFVDAQVRGPYRLWRHTHVFEDHPEGTLVRDSVSYEIPLGPVGELARQLFVRRDLDRIFEYRRLAVAEALGADVQLTP